jgi:hypothetical protein
LRVASPLLLLASDASASEGAIVQKRSFKVLSPIEKRDGGKFWMRVGSAYVNKDDSINVYLDAMPKTFELQLRELTEEDFQRSAAHRERAQSAPRAGAPFAANTPDQLPF